jgi:hypothetical protein
VALLRSRAGRAAGLGVLLLAPLAGVCIGTSRGLAAPAGNPIQVENAKPGTRAWRVDLVPQHVLEGYASEVSVLPGQTLHVHVSSSARLRYKVLIYRIGWYHGKGGRLMPCVPCRVHRAAARPIPGPDPSTGMLALTWPVTDAVPIGSSWVSGYYLADLVVQQGSYKGRGSWVPFIVREPPTRDAPILVQASVNTWQAYNSWGGRSLYWNHTGLGDNHVSFDRPYNMLTSPDINGSQENLPKAWEFPLARFLERYGYAVAYTTDVDTDTDPAELLRHKLVIVSGHDEYWTTAMRDAFEQARDAGVNLAFVGANIGYWQMRYEDDRRTIVEYRSAALDPEADPALKTVPFRDLVPPRPECELLGVQWEGEIGDADYAAVGALSTPEDSWFVGTGFNTTDDLLPELVGYEYDTLDKTCEQPGTVILFDSERPYHLDADAVRYTAPSGAIVFAAGSIRFALGLDPLTGHDNPHLEIFMRNALDAMLSNRR